MAMHHVSTVPGSSRHQGRPSTARAILVAASAARAISTRRRASRSSGNDCSPVRVHAGEGLHRFGRGARWRRRACRASASAGRYGRTRIIRGQREALVVVAGRRTSTERSDQQRDENEMALHRGTPATPRSCWAGVRHGGVGAVHVRSAFNVHVARFACGFCTSATTAARDHSRPSSAALTRVRRRPPYAMLSPMRREA
jgi:hypothetical protein